MKAVIGVDPGATGAACIIYEDKSFSICRFTACRAEEIANWFTEDRRGHPVYLEIVHSMPGQGSTSMFHFGESNGFIKGILVAYGFNFDGVNPQVWQRHFKLGAAFPSKKDRKQAHLAKAKELFPGEKITLDMCDAMLIAKFGWDKTFNCADPKCGSNYSPRASTFRH